MKTLFALGLVVLILGIASLFIPFPHYESHGIKAGDVNIGVQTKAHRANFPDRQRRTDPGWHRNDDCQRSPKCMMSCCQTGDGKPAAKEFTSPAEP